MSSKTRGRKGTVPFEEKKRTWLDKTVYEKCAGEAEETTVSTVPVSLKYKSLAILARDASNEDLLKLKEIIDAERRRRPKVIEIVLKRREYEASSDWGRFVYKGLLRLAFTKYIKNYPNLSKDVRHELIKFAVEMGEPYNEEQEGEPVSYDYDSFSLHHCYFDLVLFTNLKYTRSRTLFNSHYKGGSSYNSSSLLYFVLYINPKCVNHGTAISPPSSSMD